MTLHWPDRVWYRTGNMTDDGKPLWASREVTFLDRQERRQCEDDWEAWRQQQREANGQ